MSKQQAVAPSAKKAEKAPVKKHILDCMSEAMIETALAKAGVPFDEADDLEAKAKALQDHYKASKQELAECDTCNGISPRALDACPFCGDVEIETMKEMQQDSKKTNGASSGAMVLAKPKQQTLVKVEVVKEMSIADAKSAGEKALNESISRVATLKANFAESAWELGRELRELYDQKLFLFRLNEKGAPKYKTFVQFCSDELKMTTSSAFRWMDVSANFSRDEVRKFGHSKLALVVNLPPEKRMEALKGAEIGGTKSKAKLEQEVKELRAGTIADTGRGTAGTKAATKAAAAKVAEKQAKAKAAKAEEAKRIVVSLPDGRHKVPLMARGLSAKGEPKPAKRVSDQPVCEIEAPHGVTIKFAIVAKADGALFLQYEVRQSAS